jgi:hypothetical protein
MRNIIASKLEEGRIRDGEFGSDVTYGPQGAFQIMGPKGEALVIVSSGTDREFGWEHVSVSTRRRTPNWDEMCFVKNLFWREDECVVQFHPPKSDYVNHHPYCLHLWKPIGRELQLPPSVLVGPKTEVPA